jgi:integrase
VSTGARASELLSATQGGVDPGRQLITVIRKGTRETQQLPASSDAFVWLRLYQLEMDGQVPKGKRQPLWWTSRMPVRPLSYHAVHRMFERVNNRAGTAATLHSLRHTAAYRMAEDPALPLTDVQLVLGHAQLTTTQIYLTPRKQDVIRRILHHHAQQTRKAAERQAPHRHRVIGPRRWMCCSGAKPGDCRDRRARAAAADCARGGGQAGRCVVSRAGPGHDVAGYHRQP